MTREGLFNILTMLVILAALIICVFLGFLFINPNSVLNPLPPQDLPELVIIPTATWSSPQLPDIVTESVPEVILITATEQVLLPSSTPLPTSTSFVLPTATETLTPTATFTATATLTETPTVTPTNSAYQCIVTSSLPLPGTEYPPGGDFDGRWTLENTGTETWEASVDMVYISGAKFTDNVDAVDLKKIVAPGESYEVIVDMLAPRDAGTYETTWALRKDNLHFCQVTIRIIVK